MMAIGGVFSACISLDYPNLLIAVLCRKMVHQTMSATMNCVLAHRVLGLNVANKQCIEHVSN